MLDIRVIRENPELVKERVRQRGGDAWQLVDRVLECDETRRQIETEKQQLQSERNTSSKQIGMLKKQGQDTAELETRVRAIGDRIKELDITAERAAAEQNDMLMSIPNMPHAACPVGLDETANPEVKIWGEKPAIDNPKDHVQIAAELGLVSFEDGTRITGSGFVVYRGCGARLERALINFLLDTQTQENGYQEVGVPFVVKRECMEGTGQLPKFEDDMYGTEEQQMFLIPTAEVPVTNLYRDTILSEDSLPVKMTAHTPCFRREAGSAGRDNRGMIRIHQFDKVELVQILKPEDSFAQLEQLLGHAESILQKLGLHYRVIELCTGDLGFSSAKTYDIEVWAPGQGKYLEVSSCSCFSDYQARRMRLRYKDANGKNQFCHTLNGSGTALPRLYVALLETYQQPDGSVRIPEALVPYFGAESIRPA
ncbi:serine--tRNA ligase [Akkermansia glycaniphila]|uniref:Serine--tRNA ligase n=1 Tax=Akkermansia glycaniphila TaxID=1679444 RepID=A0A1C7PCA5_9BACT|nr:serine--tRNA ligase [Akkermansia glycaniphila]OCA03118.1 seryl-tRNA synthetase [Akkermansia glycaniphila]SEH96659.1 sers: serine--trna ligase [Akkermansia glycaniphila]